MPIFPIVTARRQQWESRKGWSPPPPSFRGSGAFLCRHDVAATRETVEMVSIAMADRHSDVSDAVMAHGDHHGAAGL